MDLNCNPHVARATSPGPTSPNRRRALPAFIATFMLALAGHPAGLGQALSTGACGPILTVHDAEACLASNTPKPLKLTAVTTDHAYTLPELIDIAEMASPEGRASWQQARASMEQAGVARAAYFPILAFVAIGMDNRFIFPFPKPLSPRGFVVASEPTALAELKLDYAIYDMGRGAKFDAAKAAELGSTLRLQRINQTIARNTAAAYYTTIEQEGQLEASRTILQTAQTLLESAQSQFDNGRATLPDVQNAQAGEAEARYELAAAEGAVKKARLILTETIGVEPTAELELEKPPSADMSGSLDNSVEELIQSAWKARPDLLARAQDVRRAHDQYRQANALYAPKAGLDSTFGQTSMWPTADYGQLGMANITTWSVEFKLEWELFDQARRHEKAAALAEQKAAVEEQRAAQDAVTRQVWSAYVDYQTAAERNRSSQSFLTAAQSSYDSSLDAYRYGVRSLVDVVQAEKQLAQARFATVRSRAAFLQSAVELSYATGSMLQPRQSVPNPGARP